MKQLHLKNSFFLTNPPLGLLSIYEWFAKQLLHGEASRNRTRFLRLVEERQKEVLDEVKKLKDEHAKRNDQNEVLYLDVTGQETPVEKDGVTYAIKDKEAFEKALEEYLGQTLPIDVTPERRDVIYGARDILLKTDDAFEGRMATLFDDWCLAFEAIKESES